MVNHSCEPNCKVEIRTVDNEQRVVLVAKQKIGIGVEITYDYEDQSIHPHSFKPFLADF